MESSSVSRSLSGGGGEGSVVYGKIDIVPIVPGTVVILSVLFFLIFLDIVFEYLQEVSIRNHSEKIFIKLKNELMMMGLISFTVFLVENSTFGSKAIGNNHTWFQAFEISHIIFLFVALAFILQALYLVQYTNHVSRTYLLYLRTSATKLQEHYVTMQQQHQEHTQKNRGISSFFFKSELDWFKKAPYWIPGISPFRDNVEFRIIERLFLKTHEVDQDFDFSRYVGLLSPDYIAQAGQVSVWSWLALAFLVVCNYFKVEVIDPTLWSCPEIDDDASHRFLRARVLTGLRQRDCNDPTMEYGVICTSILSFSIMCLHFASSHYYKKMIKKATEDFHATEVWRDDDKMKQRFSGVVGNINLKASREEMYLQCLNVIVEEEKMMEKELLLWEEGKSGMTFEEERVMEHNLKHKLNVMGVEAVKSMRNPMHNENLTSKIAGSNDNEGNPIFQNGASPYDKWNAYEEQKKQAQSSLPEKSTEGIVVTNADEGSEGKGIEMNGPSSIAKRQSGLAISKRSSTLITKQRRESTLIKQKRGSVMLSTSSDEAGEIATMQTNRTKSTTRKMLQMQINQEAKKGKREKLEKLKLEASHQKKMEKEREEEKLRMLEEMGIVERMEKFIKESTDAFFTDEETKLREIFWFKRPSLYFSFIEFILLMQCFLIAILVTQLFVILKNMDARGGGYAFFFVMAVISNFILLRFILTRAIILKAMTSLQHEIVSKVCEETIHEEGTIDKIRRDIYNKFEAYDEEHVPNDDDVDEYILNAVKLKYDKIAKISGRGINQKQFREFLRSCGVTLTSEKVLLIWQMVDYDLSGEVTFDELYIFLFPHMKKNVRDGFIICEKTRENITTRIMSIGGLPSSKDDAIEEFHKIFETYDMDKSGGLSENEFKSFLEGVSEQKLEKRQFSLLMATVDLNKNADVSFEELEALFLPPSLQSSSSKSGRHSSLSFKHSDTF